MLKTNSAVVDTAIANAQVERVSGSVDLVAARFAQASVSLKAAQVLADAQLSDPAVTQLWDAARHACEAILQAQGLRVKSEGHHQLVLDIVRDQFGKVLGGVMLTLLELRRVRNKVEYPSMERLASPVSEYTVEQLDEYIETVTAFIAAAPQLADALPLYA